MRVAWGMDDPYLASIDAKAFCEATGTEFVPGISSLFRSLSLARSRALSLSHSLSLSLAQCTCGFVCACVRVRVRVHTYVCTHTHTHTHTHISSYVYTCICMFICICLYMYMYMYVQTYVASIRGSGGQGGLHRSNGLPREPLQCDWALPEVRSCV